MQCRAPNKRMHDDMHPEILSPEDSALWRQEYLGAFVDTSGEYYQRHIALPRQSRGYLWDCLRSPSRITIQRFRHEVVRHAEVFVMAHDHPHNRIPGAPLWFRRPDSIVRFRPQALLQSLDSLPEDIYVFDSSVLWTLVLTHEDDGKRGVCYSVGIDT